MRAAQKQGWEWTEAVNVQAQTGRGITGSVEGEIAVVGKAAFVRSQADNYPESIAKQSQQWEQEGKTVVWVVYADRILGIIAIADTVRATAARSIVGLKRLGIEQIVIMTLPLGVLGHEGSTVLVF